MKRLITTLILAASLHAGWMESLGDLAKNYTQSYTPTIAKEQNAITQTLEIGVKKAIAALGKKDGFYANPLVKITLPKSLQPIASTLEKVGFGSYVKDLEMAMNRAAEEAVPQTATILLDTIKNIKPQDVKDLIFTNKKDAITQYFKTHAHKRLAQKITPIIQKYMQKEKVATYYQTLMHYYNQYAPNVTQNSYINTALGAFGIQTPQIKEQDLSSYITNRTLEGLYTMIAKQEAAIRTNPLARTTKLLKEVFGAK